MKKIISKIAAFFHVIYEKLFLINDTPQKIALGLGLGVFSGIMPGTGPIAAIFLALLFRVNRASALLGSLLTNTWLSFITFIIAIKTGAVIFRLNWNELYQEWVTFIKAFTWLGLFKLSALKIILPVITGYIVISFCLGLLVYLVTIITFFILERKRNGGKLL